MLERYRFLVELLTKYGSVGEIHLTAPLLHAYITIPVFGHIHTFVDLSSHCRFQKKLREIGKIIDNRNKKRKYPYEWLHPKAIPNAISI